MSEQRIGYGEFVMDQTQVIDVAQLDFARGKVGQRHPLITDEDKAEFARTQAGQIAEITKANTADCGDERVTVALGDGTTDPEVLASRVVAELFGGEGLATTKAMIAADAVALQDAKDFWDAYTIVYYLLKGIGEEDGGHSGCGASGSVESSVANEVDRSLLIPSIRLFVPDENGVHDSLIDKNTATKRTKLNSGFYGGWNPARHEAFLMDRVSQNFSILKDDPNDTETHGHNGRGLLVVTEEGRSIRKNGDAFSVTLPKMRELAYKLGGSEEERTRILLGFADDTIHVGAGIVTEGFPVFVQQS